MADTPTPPPSDNSVNPATAGSGVSAGASGATTGSSGTTDYNIPQVVLDKYPALVELIKKTESMTNEEREYWFQILPIMTEEQVTRLNQILEEEATQLAKLDADYKEDLEDLNQKHMTEWDSMAHEEDRKAREAAEAAAAANEAAEAQKTLDELNNI